MSTTALAVEYRSLDALIPYARNPRTHSEEQIAKIAASIVEYGWTNPVLVDGSNGVIAGHGRLAAARKLGLDSVPVIELAHLSPTQKRAYVIGDNRLALDAGWDEELLALELADYHRQYEPMLYGWRNGAQRHWCGDRNQADVWSIKSPHKNDLHPTMKPVELVERAIRNSSRPGNLILDPFGGSGTTLIAAEKSARTARLIELDPKYADVIVRRWQDWSGKQARRQADGALFDQVVSGQGNRADDGAPSDQVASDSQAACP